MSGSQGDILIHVRFRGNLFGPYTPDELRDMMRKGRTPSTWEISLDRQTWRPIRELEALVRSAYPALAADDSGTDMAEPAIVYPAESSQIPRPAEMSTGDRQARTATEFGEAQWYYAEGDRQIGPVPESRMMALARAGELSPQTLVWTLNMETWRPLVETRLRQALKGGERSEPVVTVTTASTIPESASPTVAPPLLPETLSLQREQLTFLLAALAVASGVALLLKLILLPFAMGGLVLLAAAAECAVLGLLTIIALITRSILQGKSPRNSGLFDFPPPTRFP